MVTKDRERVDKGAKGGVKGGVKRWEMAEKTVD